MLKIKEETFVNIKGYDGRYKIGNKGTVIGLSRSKDNRYNNKQWILKQYQNKNGYMYVTLQKNKKRKTIKVHRLVAENFLENPDNLPQINHIDGNKKNNNVNNLEFCTAKHNMQEAYRLGLIKGGLKDKFGKDYPKKINIIGMYKDGILLEKFYGTGEIKRKYNYVPVAILDCCKGKYKKMYGYEWRFINEQV